MLPGGQNAIFEGNLDDYPRLAQVSGFPNILERSAVMTPSATADSTSESSVKDVRARQRSDAQAEKREKQKLTRKISDLEEKIQNLQEQISTRESALLDVGSDYQKAHQLSEEMRTLKDSLGEAEAAWFEASELLQNLNTEGGAT